MIVVTIEPVSNKHGTETPCISTSTTGDFLMSLDIHLEVSVEPSLPLPGVQLSPPEGASFPVAQRG